MVLKYLGFMSTYSVICHGLVQADLEVFLFRFTLMEKKDCFRFPMNVGWCIKIRDTQNAFSLMVPDIPN